MSAQAQLQRLQRWCAAGRLRALDVAFASLIGEIDPQAPPSLLLAAALLAQLEGRGHACLPMDQMAQDPGAVMDEPGAEPWPEAAAAFADWPGDAAAASATWGARTVVDVGAAAAASGTAPLVLDGSRLYLRRHWRAETVIAAALQSRVHPEAAAPPPGTAALLARLFGTAPQPGGGPDWQQVACAVALRARATLVTGGPGTGKTHTAARLLVLLHALHAGPRPLRVALAAPTGKAAARLRQAIDTALQSLRADPQTAPLVGAGAAGLGVARTLHALLGARRGSRHPAHDAARPIEADVVVVDEASMIHLEMMAALLAALPPGARLVLLGDPDQLASVEAGAVLGDLCRAAADGQRWRPDTARWLQAAGQPLPANEVGAGSDLAQQTVRLRRSRRYEAPIGRLAQAVNGGDGAAALALLREEGAALARVDAAGPEALLALALPGYAGYLDALARRPAGAADFDAWVRNVLARFDDFRVLCAVRAGPWGVEGVNAAIDTALAGRLGSAPGAWYAGRPVLVTRNDPDLGVFNGDVGVVLAAPGGGALRAWFQDGAGLRSVAIGRLADVETAWALTVHKSQGSEFGHVVLVLPPDDVPVATRELVYTGVTRARAAFTLAARGTAPLHGALGRLTRRHSGLRARLHAPGAEEDGTAQSSPPLPPAVLQP